MIPTPGAPARFLLIDGDASASAETVQALNALTGGASTRVVVGFPEAEEALASASFEAVVVGSPSGASAAAAVRGVRGAAESLPVILLGEESEVVWDGPEESIPDAVVSRADVTPGLLKYVFRHAKRVRDLTAERLDDRRAQEACEAETSSSTIEPAAAQRPPLPPLEVLKQGTETILFVEDEEPLRRAGARVLERFGYTVIEAGDGVEALEALVAQAADIDLVVSDIVMPNLGGRGLWDEMKKLATAPPMLFVSGYSREDLPDDDRLDDSVDILKKPWAVPDLLDAIRTTLDEAYSVPH